MYEFCWFVQTQMSVQIVPLSSVSILASPQDRSGDRQRFFADPLASRAEKPMTKPRIIMKSRPLIAITVLAFSSTAARAYDGNFSTAGLCPPGPVKVHITFGINVSEDRMVVLSTDLSCAHFSLDTSSGLDALEANVADRLQVNHASILNIIPIK